MLSISTIVTFIKVYGCKTKRIKYTHIICIFLKEYHTMHPQILTKFIPIYIHRKRALNVITVTLTLLFFINHFASSNNASMKYKNSL